ncbi:hypothetical protein HNY73_002738 [Argiope bruennichi]|uniref:Transcriptional coactivator p15 (PC4) C-terminal domain-containing protein n=1 Tax=Argiope bruennichi TaxID=94029 RepID=A0A8T0FXA3_ARGBR|nr:hypothetical protein HNY73_002738 [Argiope bruennichi]
MCFNDRVDEEITTDTLPKYMVHLDDDLFILVNTFQKETRVYIRVYSTDGNGVLHPTKEGMSLKPEVWNSLVSLVKKDVCVFNLTVSSEKCVSLQRFSQKKNGSFQLVPERVLLKGVQINRLC